MRRSREILGLPIVTVSEGTEVGKVKDLVIDTKSKEVVALLIDDPEWYKSPKAVLLSSLRGLGQDVVIIDSQEKISVIAETKELEEPLQNNIRIMDTKVITTSGKIVGRVKEFLIDPDSGKITAYEIEEIDKPEKVKTIPAEQILTLGSDVLIIGEEEEGKVIFPKREEKEVKEEKQKEEVKEVAEPTKAEVNSEVKEETEAKAVEEEAAEPAVKEEVKAEVKEEEKAPEKEEAEKVKEVLEERQKDFLLGKTARKDILDDDGAFIIKKGEVITEEVINKAKETNKYLELSFSTKRF